MLIQSLSKSLEVFDLPGICALSLYSFRYFTYKLYAFGDECQITLRGVFCFIFEVKNVISLDSTCIVSHMTEKKKSNIVL